MCNPAWLIHELVIPRRGAGAIGVARQAFGPERKAINCQVAVVLSHAAGGTMAPVACRLFLPKEWATDPERRRASGIPPQVAHLARTDIALDLLATARATGTHTGPVVADVSYGRSVAFRATLASRGFPYVVEVKGNMLIRPGGPLADSGVLPAEQVATLLGVASCQDAGGSRYLACRVRPVFPGDGPATHRPEQWLLAEWPAKEPWPRRFWLATPEPFSSVQDLARAAELGDRARALSEELIERSHVGDYVGPDWSAFHRHAARCLADHAKGTRSVMSAAAT